MRSLKVEIQVGSQGPHLHFEIRETKTGRSLNPLLFGMPLQDDVAPTLLKLAMYDRSISTYEQTPKNISFKKNRQRLCYSKNANIKNCF